MTIFYIIGSNSHFYSTYHWWTLSGTECAWIIPGTLDPTH